MFECCSPRVALVPHRAYPTANCNALVSFPCRINKTAPIRVFRTKTQALPAGPCQPDHSTEQKAHGGASPTNLRTWPQPRPRPPTPPPTDRGRRLRDPRLTGPAPRSVGLDPRSGGQGHVPGRGRLRPERAGHSPFEQHQPPLSLRCHELPDTWVGRGRNTGILSLDIPVLAFCDADDERSRASSRHRSDLLSRDLRCLLHHRLRVDVAGPDHRPPGLCPPKVTLEHFARLWTATLHSSAFVFRRVRWPWTSWPAAQALPKSMAEDWDLLIRAARVCPVLHIDYPYVLVVWGASSHSQRWAARSQRCHQWLIDHHPENSMRP